MKSLLIRWVIMTVAILIAGSIIPGVRIDSPMAAFLAAVILSLLNAFVRPILIILTLPINILTLGIFVLVINGGLLLIVAALLKNKGFSITGFGPAFLAALVISVVGFLLNLLVGGDRK